MKLARVAWLVVVLAGSLGAAAGGASAGAGPSLFVAGDRCSSCHNGLTASSGEDVSIGTDWRGSVMANAARDPYWQAAVRGESVDHPAAGAAIENECAICHMPMASVENKAGGLKTGVFDNLTKDRRATRMGRLAVDGVSCTVCHQITKEGLGGKESQSGGFVVDTKAEMGQRNIYGNYDVDGTRSGVMKSTSGFGCAKASHMAQAELCAVCHTLYTHALDEKGVDRGEFPEQVPYLEWKHSSHSPAETCQSCHMPRFKGTPIASRLGQDREFLGQHVFQGGNFLLPRILDSNREELGVEARGTELAAASEKSLEYLKKSSARLGIAKVEITAERLTAEVSIGNLAGHKLPTGYPSRRVWVHFTVKGRNGEAIFESGTLQPDGAIKGNDNDSDAATFEPHYREIDSPEKVQIYEAIMTNAEGKVTTGLLTGVKYIKDNRLLPAGFDKAEAGADIAVRGTAIEDGDFGGGEDRIRYLVKIRPEAGPFTVEAELMYQPIGYRWAQNLRAKKGVETDRFGSMFEAKAKESGVVIARASAGPKP